MSVLLFLLHSLFPPVHGGNTSYNLKLFSRGPESTRQKNPTAFNHVFYLKKPVSKKNVKIRLVWV